MHPPSHGDLRHRSRRVGSRPFDPARWVRLLALACVGALLLVLVAPGCGRSSLEPESLGDGGASSACGPSTCPDGCCDSSGRCRVGSDVRACGSLGGRCSDCVANGFTLCSAARVCGRDDPSCSPATCSGCCALDEGRRRCLSGTEPSACGRSGASCADCAEQGRACDLGSRACGTTSCSAANCDGCCVGDKCLPGDIATACGAKGEACGACAPGQACRALAAGGRCEGVTACGPASCDGCCDAAGRCLTGNDTTACGKQGDTCAACRPEQVCVPEGRPNERTCQAQATCGPSNCAGCCVGNQCVIATTPQACGVKGEACKTCGPDQVCGSAGTCVQGSSECNPASCAGCCVGDICAVGTQNTACGGGGALCQNCASQTPARVCQSGVCQLPSCGPATCPNGCCSGNTCVVGTQDNACGLTGGGVCQDCTATSQVCEGRQCRDRCSAANCSGCCQANNRCATGIANNACGSGGAACANCAQSGSFCNGLVVPRRCNNQQTTCPATYGTCAPGIATPVTPRRQNLCTDADLDTLTVACAGGADASACDSAHAALPAACRTCLAPFKHPYEQNTGLWACAASQVHASCRRSTGCATDCAQTSCAQCLPTSENQCHALVNGVSGQCRSYSNAASCANAALAAGQLCSPYSYADFGQWLRSVGDHFCGDGP